MSQFFTDYDDVANKQGGGAGASKFGLNQNAVISSFNRFDWENPDGTPNETFRIEFQFQDENGNIIMNKNGDNAINKSKLLGIPRQVNVSDEHGGGQTDDYNHPDFEKVINQTLAETTGMIHTILGDDYKKAMAAAEQGASNKVEYFQNLIKLVESDKFQAKLKSPVPCDLFLCYPYNPSDRGMDDEGNKYLDLPSNIKHGRIVYARQSGTFTPDENQPEDPKLGVKPLVYVNENGDIHPIRRTAWFMQSNFAIRKAVADNEAGGQNWEKTETADATETTDNGGW